MSENTPIPPDAVAVPMPAKQRSRLRRIACGIGSVIWIILLLLPCIAIVLIAQNEIAIQVGDVPGQSFRVWLIQDATERGIGIARPSIHSDQNSNTCLQTDTSFIMWMGKGDAASFCECYAREGDTWKSVSSAQGLCNP
jgi:hypothetical protein